jgi:hypothetical protein
MNKLLKLLRAVRESWRTVAYGVLSCLGELTSTARGETVLREDTHLQRLVQSEGCGEKSLR